MRRIVTITFAAGLCAVSAPALAANVTANANHNDPTARAQAQADGASANADDRRICVREPGSETRIRRVVCHTAREWRDLHGDENNNG